jgi:hypothetical protein
MEVRRLIISKSKFVAGLQCPKLLWHSVNTPEQMPAPDAQTQAIFDQGHEIGSLAKTLFPGGLEIGEGVIYRQAVVQWTRDALPFRKPLFEAALEHCGGYARADILNPVAEDEWEIVEVKSSTDVKEVFLEDIAFQHFVFTGVGLKIRSCRVLHVNNSYVRNGEVDARSLFKEVDVTVDVLSRTGTVRTRLEKMLQVVALDASPVQKIGPQCDAPHTCPLHNQCWSFLPDGHVLELYRGKKKGFDLIDRGVTRLAEIPDGFELTASQKIQRAAATSGEPHVDLGVIRQFLERLEYPLHFLDFESFMSAIPLLEGVRPYQQIAFQFSLHIVTEPGAEPIHRSFLAESTADPRRTFIDSLQSVLRDTGSVVVYNASFEQTRLRECCDCFPEISDWLRGIDRRFVDLLTPFRAFAYYHPAQKGSASIKAVLPVLGNETYEQMQIGDGAMASREFVRVVFGDVPEEEKQRVRGHLQQYCSLDTRGMVLILDALRKHVFAYGCEGGVGSH